MTDADTSRPIDSVARVDAAGLDAHRLRAWLLENVAPDVGPLREIRLIGGGTSDLT